jgi:putative membrane protein
VEDIVIAAQLAAGLAALLHVVIFVMESVLFSRPKVYRRFMITTASDAAVAQPWALNQGFYNLFLAIGAFVGVALLPSAAGRALVLLACGSMLAAGIVLICTDRRMLRAGVMQALFPAIAVIAVIAG